MTKRSNTISRRTFLEGATGIVASTLVAPAYGDDLVVVVHPGNTESLSRAQLAAVFTTSRQTWGGGERIVPFNFPPRHEIRVDFDEAVLEMSPDEVARYWIDRKIRGGTPPPKAVNSPHLIVKLVSKLEGGIAYVPRSVVDDSVRVVQQI